MNRVARRTVSTLALALALLALGSCNEAVYNPDTARVQVLLTDAPVDYLDVAEVCISRVYLQPSDEDPPEGEETPEPERLTLWEKDAEGDPQCFDLLMLDGLSVAVTEEVEIPAGTYHQLRFVVESASVTLADERTFEGTEDGTADLKVPSGTIKVQLLEPVVAEALTVTEITVDADVNENFVIQGNPETPAGVKGVLFTPHLKEVDRQTTEPES